MINKIKEIKRFWCKSYDGILDQAGFLEDPERKYYSNGKKVFSLEKPLTQNACIFLSDTTEEGSHEFSCFYKIEKNEKKNDLFFYYDLSSYYNESRLIDEVFNIENKSKLLEGNNKLYLFIASYDLCLNKIPTLTKIFIAEIEKLCAKKEQLYIRILSSSGLWDVELEQFFSTFWGGKEKVLRLSIAPLRSRDVSELCSNININEQDFLSVIETKELQPFAMNVITLNYLLQLGVSRLEKKEVYKEDLYYNSSLYLCETTLGYYRLKEAISPKKMLAIASRIAAIMVFCKHTQISCSRCFCDTSRNVLSAFDIFEEKETTGEYSFVISYHEIIQTLQFSGLFYKDREGFFSFYYSAIQNFLAARFLINHEFDEKKTISLFTNSRDEEDKILERVKYTYNWLQNMTPKMDLIKYFASHDPLRVLEGRIISDDEFKKDLVKDILKKIDRNEIYAEDWNLFRKNGNKLYYPQIASHLVSYIKGRSKAILARGAALDIAVACDLEELQDAIWSVVQDQKEELAIRERAISALSNLVNSEVILKGLCKLAISHDMQDDLQDELKGNALEILCEKDKMTSKDIFKALSAPKKNNYVGVYKFFIDYKFSRMLGMKDIKYALDWLIKNIDELEKISSDFEQLITSIIWIGWNNYSQIGDKNQKSFAEMIYKLLEKHQSVFPKVKLFLKDSDEYKMECIPQEIRFDVINRLFSLFKDNESFYLYYIARKLVLLRDFESIIGYCQKQTSKIHLWKKLLLYFNTYDKSQRDLLTEYFPCEVKSTFAPFFNEEKIKEAEADCTKEKRQETEKKKKKEEANRVIKSDLQRCIKEFKETKDIKWWIHFFRVLGAKLEGQNYCTSFSSLDIIEYENWKLLTDENKKEIRLLAKYFIGNFDEDFNSWFGKNLYSYQASAGFKSLMLIMYMEGNSYVESLNAEVLEKWSHIIIDYPKFPESKEHRDRKEFLIKILFEKMSLKANKIIKQKLLIEINKGDYLFSLEVLESNFTEDSEQILFELLKDSELTNKQTNQIINLLLEKSPVKTFEYIKKNIHSINDNDELEVYLLSSLLRNFDDFDSQKNGYWEFVYSKLENRAEKEKKCYLSLAGTDRFSHQICGSLNVNHLSALYERLYRIFPPEEDPKFEGIHSVGERECVGSLRDNLLRTLTGKGTDESIQEINRLKERLPNIDLSFYFLKAKDNFRNTNDDIISATDFQRLSRNGEFRVISNGDELLKLIEESLIRLEAVLQGAQPMAFCLWDIVKDKEKKSKDTTPSKAKDKTKPKGEEHLSNFVAQYIRQDLCKYAIMPYREVELRCKRLLPNNKSGENVDILVSCNLRGKNICVIIEVKGSWNKECPTNMELQLYDRYMQSYDCDYGLYLIGWYRGKHDSVNRTGSHSIETAKKKYAVKAKDLSERKNVSIKSFVLDCRLNEHSHEPSSPST